VKKIYTGSEGTIEGYARRLVSQDSVVIFNAIVNCLTAIQTSQKQSDTITLTLNVSFNPRDASRKVIIQNIKFAKNKSGLVKTSMESIIATIEDIARQPGAVTRVLVEQQTTPPTQSAGDTLQRGLLDQIQKGAGTLRRASAQAQPEQRRGGVEGVFDQQAGLLAAAAKFNGARGNENSTNPPSNDWSSTDSSAT
jgi:hypothetical protein